MIATKIKIRSSIIQDHIRTPPPLPHHHPDVRINQLRKNQITQLNGSARRPRRHAPRVTTTINSTCCHFFFFFLTFIQSRKRAQMAPIERPRSTPSSSPEINSIWCPEDGWNSPQRHGVYEFRERDFFFLFVNRRGKMKARKNEDEVGGNAVYETTRIHSQGSAVSDGTNVKFFRNSFQPAR